jgi:CubicO group peptidase (beta-lactamase class C family)
MDIVSPASQGFSSTRLARILPAMQRYVDEKKLAGILSLIARRGQVVHFETCGMADIEAGKPMQTDTIFRIYSMSKPITSAAVLMLFEEGRFRLHDPVARYLPAFEKMRVLESLSGLPARLVDAARQITIIDLLTHTAGLSYGFDDKVYIDYLYRKRFWAALDANPEMNLEGAVAEIAKLPLAFQPGTAWRYSVATDVLGCLVQVASGMPFEDYLKQRIFDPLGMVDTGFYVPPEKVARFTAVYGPDEKNGLKAIDLDPATNPSYLKPSRFPSGGGGLVSTAGDYLRFCQMLLNGGVLDGVRLLGRKTVEFMTTNHLPDGIHPDNPAGGFGLGVDVLLHLGKSALLGSVGNYGWGGAANTNFWVDPKEQLIGILMLQFMPSDTYPVIADFRTLTYQALVD